jgi:hypothetical protein
MAPPPYVSSFQDCGTDPSNRWKANWKSPQFFGYPCGLVAWKIWKHRNDCIYNAASPDVNRVVKAIVEEGVLWCAADAKHLLQLASAVLEALRLVIWFRSGCLFLKSVVCMY